MDIEVRPIRAHEWREVRDLRLRALRDEAAGIAFLDTFADASARPDDFWIQRAEAASSDAGAEARARQFVALAGPSWVGSVSVLLGESGPDVVGVYLDPAHRGSGTIGRLLDAAAEWVRERGFDRVRLTVHARNARAQAAYAKAGFRPTGVELTSSIGPELEMIRAV